MNFDDTLSLIVNGVAWQGWERIRITRGIERMPSDFAVTTSERYPGNSGSVDIIPGLDVVVKIGSDVVITGYIDRYAPSIDAGSHTIEITGRGKCQDLVDCSAIFTGQQIMQTTAIGIAQVVSRPFGITATQISGPSRSIDQFNTVLTETPYAIIERVTRFSGLLAYEGTDGNLILGTVGTDQMASGFAQGVNIQSARATFGMDQRFSDLTAIILSNNIQADTKQTNGSVGVSQSNTVAVVKDPGSGIGIDGKPRYRPRLVVSEQGNDNFATAMQRANWEVARRYGRSQVITITCDSWRDSSGKLWAPNTLATVNCPFLKLPGLKWLITEVTFSKDLQRGTIAEVTLMPPTGFSPEPIILYPFDVQLAQDLAAADQQAKANVEAGGPL